MGYVLAGKEKLHYLKWGTGKRLLLAFHGYGNEASLFETFVPYLHNEYTILSIDLPHHGNSKWTKDVKFTRENLAEVINNLKSEYKVDKVSLLGYSMGGRVSVVIVQDMPESVDKVVLIATDGLTVNYFYYFLTRTYLGRKIFKNELARPERFLGVVEWLKNKKLLSAHRYKFVLNYMKPEKERKFLMQVWPGMSDLMPLPMKLKRTIKQYHIPIAIFMGAYDRIMPPSLGEKFKTGLDTVHLYVLEKGHRVFDSDNAKQIAEHLL